MNTLGWTSKAKGNLFYLGWLPEPKEQTAKKKTGGIETPTETTQRANDDEEVVMLICAAFMELI